MYDEGVGAGDIEPGFDDRGAHQDIVGAVVEGAHDLLQLAGGEPAVGDCELHLGHAIAEEAGNLRQVLDARTDVEGLAAAIVLAQDRLAHDHRIERQDEGPDGEAIDRRGGDQAHVLDAAQRQLQGPGDRRGGQCEHVDVGLELLQALLVLDAEMLLLVDDQQHQIAEAHALAQQRVGADDDVDLPAGQAGAGLGRLFRRHQTRELAGLHGQSGEALTEGAEVLATEQRRRGDDCHLSPGHHRGERRS